MVIVAFGLVDGTEVAIEDGFVEDFCEDKVEVIWLRYFIKDEFEVAGVADGLGHLIDGMLVIGGKDLVCEFVEMAHGV